MTGAPAPVEDGILAIILMAPIERWEVLLQPAVKSWMDIAPAAQNRILFAAIGQSAMRGVPIPKFLLPKISLALGITARREGIQDGEKWDRALAFLSTVPEANNAEIGRFAEVDRQTVRRWRKEGLDAAAAEMRNAPPEFEE